MKQITQRLRDGRIDVIDIPPPALTPDGVLVDVRASLLSAGTERTKIQTGQAEPARQGALAPRPGPPGRGQGPPGRAARHRPRRAHPARPAVGPGLLVRRASCWPWATACATWCPATAWPAPAPTTPCTPRSCTCPSNLCAPLPDGPGVRAGRVRHRRQHRAARRAPGRLPAGRARRRDRPGAGGPADRPDPARRRAARWSASTSTASWWSGPLADGAADHAFTREQLGDGDPPAAAGECDAVVITAAAPLVRPGRAGRADVPRPRPRGGGRRRRPWTCRARPTTARSWTSASRAPTGPAATTRSTRSAAWTTRSATCAGPSGATSPPSSTWSPRAGWPAGPLITERIAIDEAEQAYERLAGGERSPLGIVVELREHAARRASPRRAGRGRAAAAPRDRAAASGVIGAGSFAQGTMIPGPAAGRVRARRGGQRHAAAPPTAPRASSGSSGWPASTSCWPPTTWTSWPSPAATPPTPTWPCARSRRARRCSSRSRPCLTVAELEALRAAVAASRASRWWPASTAATRRWRWRCATRSSGPGGRSSCCSGSTPARCPPTTG